MLPPHLAARELERRRSERASEVARQLPLHLDDQPPPSPDDDTDGTQPDWAVNY